MKPPKCRVCGLEEWRHVCVRPAVLASNTASNKTESVAAKGVASASNKKRTCGGAKVGRGTAGHAGGVSGGGESAVLGTPRKQRWSRDAYNAYQRDLMRARRAKKREAAAARAGSEVATG